MDRNEEERILSITVKYADAIKGIAEYNHKIDELRVGQMALNAQLKTGSISQEEYGQQSAATAAVIDQYKETVRVLRKEVQNNLRQEQEQEGSLKSLRAQLSNLTKEFDGLSRAEREGAKGKDLMNHINAVTTELKRAEEETQRYFRNVGNYPGAVKPLKQELKELTMQLAEMERNGLRGSEAYNEMTKRAGALADNIADARAEIQHFASDTPLLDNTVNIVTTASTAWQTYQGAVQAFGVESQEAMEAMSKLQGIMAMTNGVQALAKTFTDNSTASYKILHGILRLVGIEKKAEAVATTAETTATQANTAAQTQNATATAGVTAANVAETAALNTTTGAMTAATVAGKVLRAVLMTLGIGLVVAALGALVSLAGDVIDFFFGTSEEAKHAAEIQEALNEALDEGNKAYAKASAEIDSYKSRLSKFNGSKEQEKELVKELNDKYGKAMGYYKTAEQWQEVLTKNGEAYCRMLLKEAEAQALLNKYTEAFITLQETQRKAASEFGNWTTTKAGDEERKRNAVAQAQRDADMWMAEYKKKMQEAQDIKFDWNFTEHTDPDAGKGGSGDKGKKDDPAKAAAEAAKKEREEIRKAEDLLQQLIENNLEQRREQIRKQYDRQIEDLQRRLAEEKNLTEAARVAMNGQLVSLQQIRDRKLAELDAKAMEDAIKREQANISLLLETVRKGSQEEYQLKAAKIENERQLALNAAQLEMVSEEEKQIRIMAINKKYAQMHANLLDEQTRAELDAIKKRYQEQILAAETSDDEMREVEALRLQMEEKQALLNEAQQLEGETIQEFNIRKLQMEKDYQDAKKALNDKEVEIEKVKYEAIAGLMGGLSQVAEAFGEENEGLAKMAKVLALGEIAVNTGKAIAAGVAQAQSVPYPANLAAIATTVATVLANVATAIKTVKSAKFAEGGAVDVDGGSVNGPGTATSDSIPARLSKGESVLTAAATSMFAPALSAFNQIGGGVPITVQNSGIQTGEEFLANAVARGMAMAPAPTVSVEEINKVSDRLDSINKLNVIE